MGKRSTITGYWRARGATEASASKSNGPSVGVLAITLAVTVDPAAAAGTATGKYLPAGSIVLRTDVISGHTGGTAPLLDIGVTGTNDALVNGAAADADVSVAPGDATAGANVGAAAAADIEIVAGTGGGVAGTGTSVAYITYTMSDDGKLND